MADARKYTNLRGVDYSNRDVKIYRSPNCIIWKGNDETTRCVVSRFRFTNIRFLFIRYRCIGNNNNKSYSSRRNINGIIPLLGDEEQHYLGKNLETNCMEQYILYKRRFKLFRI